tara:strand:- start:700 stop:1116 length:417 start_codon:yes stop_codon:yes gene_type:complete
MSRLPKVDDKPKNNKSNKFRWVDSQWEKLLNKQQEDLKIINQLREDLITCNKFFQGQRNELLRLEMENAELKDMVLDNGGDYTNEKQLHFDFEIEKNTENDDFKVKKPMIYESPDGGKTIYGRRAGDKVREQFNRECD